MTKTTKRKAELKPITVRISGEAYDTVTDLAREYHLHKSDILRMAIDSSLARSLERMENKIRYVDKEQASTINQNIIALGNVLIDVRNQMRRIGVNFNRAVKLKNIEQKRKAVEEREQAAIKNKLSSASVMKIISEKDDLEREIQCIKADTTLLNKDEINNLVQRVEDAIKKAGEVLCMFR